MKEKKKVAGQLGVYLQWPLLLSALIIMMNVVIGAIDPIAGLAMSGFTVVYLIIAVLLYLYKKKSIMAGMVEFSADYAWIQKKLLNELDIPYAIIDEEGRILWMNDQFTQIVKEEKGKLKTLSAMFPDITKENLMNLKENASIHSTFGESCYRVELKLVTIGKDDINPESGQEVLVEDRSMITVYLFDETEILRLSQEVNDQKMVLRRLV